MIQQHACKYRVKTRAGDFTNLLSKSGGSELRHQQTFAGWRLASARFCQQSVKSLACFHTVVPDFLLDGGSLPPDFARGRCQTNYIANRHGFVKGGGERGVNKGRGVRRLPPPPPRLGHSNYFLSGKTLVHSSLLSFPSVTLRKQMA